MRLRRSPRALDALRVPPALGAHQRQPPSAALPLRKPLYVVYALSVLTHLGPEAQAAWLRDLRRILKPTGLLIFTVHGDRFTPLLDQPERAAYDRDGTVTRNAAYEGQEGCAAFNAPDQVTQRLLPTAGLELVDALYEDISDEGPFTSRSSLFRTHTASWA